MEEARINFLQILNGIFFPAYYYFLKKGHFSSRFRIKGSIEFDDHLQHQVIIIIIIINCFLYALVVIVVFVVLRLEIPEEDRKKCVVFFFFGLP